MVVREASVAGFFYPLEANDLLRFLKIAFGNSESSYNNPKAIIVPHAGYEYSGKVAGTAYNQLKNGEGKHTVLLIGPSHRVPIRGVVLSDADFFETPLGRIPVNRHICERLLENTSVQLNPEAHRYEHSIEVQLPFLQYLFKDNLEIVPILTNNASPYIINSILEPIWDELSNIVVSSDLSHYLSYEEANFKDNRTCEKIEMLDYHSLEDDDACGLSGVNGLLLTLEKRHMKLKCIDKCNSGDTGSDKNRVVGYASFCTI